MSTFFKVKKGLNVQPVASPTLTENGDIAVDSSTNKAIVRTNGADHNIVTEDQTQTLTGKTIDGDDNTLSDIGISSLKTDAGAPSTFISRDGSGVVISTKAVPTGAVVGESDSQTLTNKTIDGDDNTVQDLPLTSLKTVLGDANEFIVRDGSGIVVSAKSVPTGDVVGTSDSQSLTNKTIDGDNNTISDIGIGSIKTDAGAASTFISRDGSGVVISTKAVPTGAVVGESDSQTLTNKTIDGDANTLSDIAVTSLKTDAGAASTFISRDGSGVIISTKAVPTGAVVGVSDTQTITNKDIDGGTASNSLRITVPKNTKANLDGLTRKEATLVYASDEDALYVDTGATLNKLADSAGAIVARASSIDTGNVANNTVTYMAFGAANFDTGSGVTGATSNVTVSGTGWKFTAPTTGYYLVGARVQVASATGFNGSSERLLLQAVATSGTITLGRYVPSTTDTSPQVSGTQIVQMTATDTLQIAFQQNSGGALPSDSGEVFIHRI